jgi:hypothetical protein
MVGAAAAADWDVIIAEKGEPIPGGRSISGSVLTVESVDDTDPSNVVISLLGENVSTDLEYWDLVTVELPAAWSIVSLNAEEVEAGSFYEFPTMAGVGTNVGTWSKSDAGCSGLGFLRSADVNDLARFILTVNSNGVGGAVTVSYMIEGDSWGSSPHVVCSTSSACGYDACFGAVTPEATTDLTMTIQQPQPTPVPYTGIPTTSTVGLMVLIGMILAAGVFLLIRRS